MCSFILKCHWFPFLVRCISGSRALLSFLVDDSAKMMVASTMLPSFSAPLGQVIPDLPNGSCASPRRSGRRRKSGSSSRPAPSLDSPRQGAGRSPPRKYVLHRRIAQIAERLNAVHRQWMRPPFGHVGAMRASSRAHGIRPSIRSGKISRHVLRFLRSHSRLVKVKCRRHCMS